jgi:TonB-dependent starch-binding outer membrane protein SusC
MYQTTLKRIAALAALTALTCLTALAQTISGVGKVTDLKGEALIGVSVVQKGTTNGVMTDVDGSFKITAPMNSQLEISCIGYISKTVKMAARLDIVLEEDSQMLDETVVVGYGTMRKKDVTGAMVSVTSEDLISTPANNAVEALQGKAAGVVIGTADLRPGSVGSIRIRGINAIKDTDSASGPLIVIDGIIGQSVGLDMLNPQDIETIDVLKDASATAVYGARGGNGVILVTTKKGKSGKLSLNYSGTATFEKIYDRVPMMNAEQYIEWRRWGYYYAGLGPSANEPTVENDRKLFTSYGTDETAWSNILRGWGLTYDQWAAGQTSTKWDGSKVQSTDWTQFTDRVGITQEHTLSASGGTDRMNAYVSFGYLNQKGTNIGQDYTRYTIRTNVDVNPVNWFKMGGAMNARFSDQEYGIDASGGISSNIPSSIHGKARNIFSYALPYDSDGKRIDYPGGDSTIATVVDEVGKSAITNLNYQLSASLYAEFDFGKMWKPLTGLKFKSSFGPQISFSQSYRYLSNESVNRISQGLDYVSSSASKNFSWLLDNMITYDKTFGDHYINATLLQEAWSKMSTTLYSMSGTGVALGMTQKWWGLNANSVGTLNSPSYNSLSEAQMASYMARMIYSFKDRYIVTLSYRYDGASQLGEGHKWAGFPSVALGWRIDQEDFMQGIGWLDQLKLRAGWGKTGNYSVGVYSTKDTLSSGVAVHGDAGSTYYYTPTTIANNAIGWETTDQYNVGIDFSVISGRLSGVFDVYRNYTNGLIFDVTLPTVTGYSQTKDNVGKTMNRGFDFTLNSINISNRDFSWRSNLNLSYTKNKILELQNGQEDMVSDGLFIGQPSSVLYGYESAGLWTDSAEDLAEMAKFNANGHKFEPGMVRPVDQNGDYKIDANYDRKVIGNTRPLWNLGFTNTFSYKNFDLSIFLYGAFKFVAQTGQYQGGREPVIYMNYYNENNKTGAEYQRPYFNTAGGDSFSGILLQKDASFLKVRQISLGYNVPKSLVKKLGLGSIKVTAQLKNPFSLYQGTSWMDSDLQSGTYTKGCVFGVNVGF